MSGETRRGSFSIDVSTVFAPDGVRRVLLQLPDGHVLLLPEDARAVARLLDSSADIAEHGAAYFSCPRCGRRSFHAEDRRQGYCSACHDWTGGARLRPTSPPEAN